MLDENNTRRPVKTLHLHSLEHSEMSGMRFIIVFFTDTFFKHRLYCGSMVRILIYFSPQSCLVGLCLKQASGNCVLCELIG